MDILTFEEFINEGKVNDMTPEEFRNYLYRHYDFKRDFHAFDHDLNIPYYKTFYKKDDDDHIGGEHILDIEIEYMNGKPYDITIEITDNTNAKNQKFLKLAKPLGIIDEDGSFGIDRYIAPTHRRIVKIIDAIIDVYGGPRCLIQKKDIE